MMNAEKRARLAVLTRHIGRLEAHLERLEALDARFFWARLVTLIVGGLATFLAVFLGPGQSGVVVLAVFVAVFASVVFLHRRVDRSKLRFRMALQLAFTQVARMQLDWEHIPSSPPTHLDVSHPFGSDLNLVGEHSLHRLIDTSISRGGSERLRNWLLNPIPDPGQIQQRQAILQEMQPLTGFRSRLSLNGMLVTEETKKRWDGEKLLGWLEGKAAPRSLSLLLVLLLALAALNVALFVLNAIGLLPPYWTISLTLYAGIYLYKHRDYESLFADAYDLGKSLNQFRAILVYLETYPYRGVHNLARLCMPFWQAERRPSRYLVRITWITSAASLQNNQFLSFLVNAIVPWDLYFAHLLNKYQEELRKLLPGWLDTWYELEALNSFANFAHLNPGYIYPDVVAGSISEIPLVFEARNLGHPLLPDGVRICNDFSINKLGEIAIVTGSNMSGKSTFLRTLGANLCLAYAGGPVNASSLRVILFRIFTCIQVSDSLSDGISYFYAEVRRLKALLVELERQDAYPLFFLIDEIFRGTNNQERRIGSHAYVRALAGGNGAGVISTHDLELIKLADEGPGIFNYHFREDVKDSRMVFDYRLRPGPCPTTNALKIMSMEGLPIDSPARYVSE